MLIFKGILNSGGGRLSLKVGKVISSQGDLRLLKLKFKEWNKDVFGEVGVAKRDCEVQIADLDRLEGRHGLDENRRKEREELRRTVADLIYKEEIMWKQRGKVVWAREGDGNTKFFHRLACGRRKRNYIDKLEVEGSGEIEDEGLIESEILNFFKNLYTSNAQAGWMVEGLNWCGISPEKARWIERPFEEEEVKRAVFDGGRDKSPGPDGFSMLFFQVGWDTIKGDIMKVMGDFFSSGVVNAITNETFICLIPK